MLQNLAVIPFSGAAVKDLPEADDRSAYTNIRILQAIPSREVQQFGYAQNPGW